MTTRTDTPEYNPPAPADRKPGIREVALLFVAAAFASLMFDLPDVAVICGALAAIAWAAGMLRRPRLSWNVTMAVGAGLVVTYFWWPADHWSSTAIPLMWVGLVILLVGATGSLIEHRRHT